MILVILTLILNFSFAGEPDNFSARLDKEAPFANDQINATINSIIDLATDQYVPTKEAGCDQKRMLYQLEDELDRNSPRIYKAIYLNVPFAGVKKHKDLPYEKGLPYTDLYYSESFKIKASNKNKDYVIGLDKIDHFFSHGSTYWDIIGKDPSLSNAKIMEALDIGIKQENATWGLQNTKVKSYGDLSANYHGIFFWRDFFNGKPPIVTCINGKYVRTKDFKVEEYFDESMDETINCNSYANLEVYNRLEEVHKKRKFSCPADPESCEQLKIKFGPDISKKILHPRCLGTGQSQIEEASEMTTKDVIDAAQAVMGGGGNFLLFKLFPPKKVNPAKNLKQGVR